MVVLRRAGLACVLIVALVVDLLLWGLDGHSRLGFVVPLPVVVSSAAVVFAALFRQAQLPRTGYLLAWFYCVTWGLAIPTYQPFTALLVALYLLARQQPARKALPYLVIAAIPITINTVDTVLSTDSGISGTSVTVLVWCVVFGVAWLAARSGFRTERTAVLREERLAAVSALALQNERLRLARELHDIVAHSVSAIIMQAAGARQLPQHELKRRQSTLETIEVTGVQAMRELRSLLGLLHDPESGVGGPDASPGATLAELPQLLESTQRCAVEIETHLSGAPVALRPEISHLAYRIIQEALTNVIKHAGAGVRVQLRLHWTPSRLTIEVESASNPARQRRSTGLPPSGFGLDGLRARVSAGGGQFYAGWAEDAAFLVCAELPTDVASESDQANEPARAA